MDQAKLLCIRKQRQEKPLADKPVTDYSTVVKAIEMKWHLYGVALLSVFFIAACDNLVNSGSNQSLVDQGVQQESAITIYTSSNGAVCGASTYALTAGMLFDAGTLDVSNDEEYLYVTYNTVDGWEMIFTHLHVAKDINEIPATAGGFTPGQFDYISDHIGVTHFMYQIELAVLDAEPGDELVFAAFADVFREVNGNFQNENAWGGDLTADSPNWAMYDLYTVQECGPVCYGNESAWADGERYNERGNWATYLTFNGDTSSAVLFAGRQHEAGTVIIEANNNGHAEINITLNEGWELQEGAETVKIQGYDQAPSGNPAPGRFNTYKGDEINITVPAYNYYGVHLDVRRQTECPAEAD